MSSESKWIKCISSQGNVRGVALQATELVQYAAAIHKIKGDSAQGLGEAIMSALLLSSYCKAGERVNLNIRGSGSYKQALVEAHPDGTTRGYIIERAKSDQIRPEGGAIGPWGEGMMSVLRAKVGEKQPYIGTVPLLTGHLAKDLTFYWAQSEQIPSAVGLMVTLGAEGEVRSAGGFLVQALPGASSAEIQMIEEHLGHLDSFAWHSREVEPPIQILAKIFQDTPFMLLEEKSLMFECTCSYERVERALMLTGNEELRAMLRESPVTNVHCDFCAKDYPIGTETLERLIKATEG